MRAGIAFRAVVAGAELRMLVLAADRQGCVGVDLESGAFVRASHPTATEPPQPFDVIAAELAGSLEPPDAARPEAVELAEAPKRVGHLSPRRAERLLTPLLHPHRLPLLGLAANAVPYWTLTGDRPSLALIDVRSDPRLRWGPWGPECVFVWQGVEHELLFADHRLAGVFESQGIVRPSRGDVARALGYRPRRLLVMLTAPIDGYCHKAVAAMLPSAKGGLS